MSAQHLPRVSTETAKSVAQVIADEGLPILPTWLNQLQEENPQIANELRAWVMGNRGTLDDMIMGPMMVYQLLRAQVVADSLNI